jgi:hypothetical protein
MMKRHLLAALASFGVASALGLAIGLPASSARQHATDRMAAERGRHAPVTCEMFEQPMGYAAVLRTGQAAAAYQTLGAQVLAQIRDRADGTTTDFVRPAAGFSAAQRVRYFSRWLPVYPQAREARFRSCDMTLSDRPADQPLVGAAVGAFVRAGYFRSAAHARAKRQEVLVSDDPAAPGSVIVTFLVTGPLYNPPIPPGSKAGPHPPMHLLKAYTAVVKVTGAAVTGVTTGGF